MDNNTLPPTNAVVAMKASKSEATTVRVVSRNSYIGTSCNCPRVEKTLNARRGFPKSQMRPATLRQRGKTLGGETGVRLARGTPCSRYRERVRVR